ncbi:MAG: 16S rRNA (adenine(1518)-N(6)/adenine(1519)-N(6))-dimethyltransferase RsmA [Muribaculaceae bacterium]|nr:16S rRNA (adenine(1518)-N(6)/adenine(1519)-N(6))-dimethyltransferase RsmA [Muribaculaceae bacterium]MDE6552852.1 16S rRNA (adenine(1518)-N(6)/adenine(1519)-N(6))-dimethyltransferase RsmA [Muribaculaceae bacterium]
MMEVKAKKALGQHFLTDLPTAERIADTISGEELSKACGPEKGAEWGRLPVVEIGPGMGVLTDFLVAAGRDVTAIEIDHESVEYLGRYKKDIKVKEGDFLRLDLNDIAEGEIALIGNYPYNISSQIFFRALEYREKIPVIAGMLQKEVAERICSGPGSKVYGILSVLLQAWYDCEYLFTVEPGVFSPPPKVRSGVLRLTRNSRTELGVDEKKFKTVVKTAFGQRRKTLRNSLSGLIPAGNALLEDPILKERPERLSVEQFIYITKALS